jgi:hypothetical protein
MSGKSVHVVPSADGWAVEAGGQQVSVHHTQSEAGVTRQSAPRLNSWSTAAMGRSSARTATATTRATSKANAFIDAV